MFPKFQYSNLFLFDGIDMTEINQEQHIELWNHTKLFKKLQESIKPDKANVVRFLENWMPQIQTILHSSGTSPKDFTLHDAGHAFRVAERMSEIIPCETQECMSPYDLAFLIMSAYLHDIGMCPEQKKVSSHYHYLLTGKQDILNESEIAQFQSWLDDDQEGIMPPLCQDKPTSNDLCKASKLISHYCRHRHNDWSADWIRSNSPKRIHDKYEPLGNFTDWIDDLILLCQSHHFGRDRLAEESLNSRLVAAPAQVLNLRYLACVLRIADILEFDPERTPEVILNHRDIDPSSLIFWYKDHGISPKIENWRLVISSRPDNAKLLRAIEEMLDQIDDELSLCSTLSSNYPFDCSPGLSERLPYTWKLNQQIHRDLSPKSGTFVYINSAFRPNTTKILQMLSGLELYGSPFAAVRELLQNSFDAIRELNAYKRLALPNPADNLWEEELGKLQRIELRLEKRPDGYWLICMDTGIGMTKQIIENHLLVSGNSRRHSIIELERRCKKAGFSTGRTGQFGIGVLSYFMIADRVIISTRRTPGSDELESIGWRFETEGIGTWGELRQEHNLEFGTKIELHLKAELFNDVVEFYNHLNKYLKESLVRVPCECHLNSNQYGCEPVAFKTGWTKSKSDYISYTIKNYGLSDKDEKATDEWLPARKKMQIAVEKERQQEIVDKQRRSLEFRNRSHPVMRF